MEEQVTRRAPRNRAKRGQHLRESSQEENRYRSILFQPDRGTGATFYVLLRNVAPVGFQTLEAAVYYRTSGRQL